MQAKSRSKQAGLTLIELSVSLAVAAVFIGGVLSLYKAASGGQRSTQIITDVQSIRAAVRQMWDGQGSFGTGNLNQTLINAERVPGAVRINGTTLNHSQNGEIRVQGAGTTFTIELTNIDPGTCTSLVLGNAGWSAIQVGGTALTLPVSPDGASSACSNNSAQTVTFTST